LKNDGQQSLGVKNSCLRPRAPTSSPRNKMQLDSPITQAPPR
jgi:hypothetical protein